MARSYKNDRLIIKTPRGSILERAYTKGQLKGRVYMRIEWDPGFGPDWTDHLQGVQAKFDTEVLRVTQPYVPYDTHMLQRSADLASDIGGGELDWATPYAVDQYYNTAESRPYSSLAGAHWGDRMKADQLPHLENFARKEASEKK